MWGSGRPLRSGVAVAGLAVVLAQAPAAPLPGAPLPAAPVSAAAVAPGTYSGPGFDACTAPSPAAMQAWLASPYRAVGIYFGGVNRACAQPELTPGWVVAQQAAGWHLIPIYLGPQPFCTTSTKPVRFTASDAAARGRASADDAVAAADALGLPRESVLIYDMEAYRTDDPTCRSAVLAFMNAWTSGLHDAGYLSGFYSSMASGVADQVAAYATPGYVHPDHLDFARWDGVATVSDPAIPAGYWSPHRLMKQYRGGHDETWGGVTINIDNDLVDFAPLPPTPFGDYSGNGWSDLLARVRSDGRLLMYPGNGSYLTAPTVLGIGWGGMREITPIGDADGDGYPDLVAITPDGSLLRYPGRGGSLAAPVSLGVGWNGLDELVGIGDFTGDGFVDPHRPGPDRPR